MDTPIDPPCAPAHAALYPRSDGRPRPDRSARLALAAQFLAGALGGGLLAVFTVSQLGKDSLAASAALFALCVVLLWAQVLLHEAGHALAGLATGRQLIGAGVGPLRLERGSGGLRMRWARSVRGIGGFAALLPVNGRGESRLAEAVYLLGGPAANLVAAAAALAVLLLARPDGTVAQVALASTAFSGVLIGAINLVPFRSQGWRSDGLGLLGLVRDTPESQLGRMQQRAVSLSLAGIRPRDWPLAQLQVPEGVPFDVATTAHVLRLSWALDRGDDAAAAEAALALAAAYPKAPDGRRQGIALMLAIHAAQSARDAALLAAWRPLCEGGLLDTTAYRHWLDAEAAAMRGDGEAARAFAAQARAALVRVHDAASVTVLRERLDGLDARL